MISLEDNHTNCIIDVVEELMNRGFICYLEQDIVTDKTKRSIIADIYAKRQEEEIIIEVGTCSHAPIEYKQANPKAGSVNSLGVGFPC
jgi:hypothetical protein